MKKITISIILSGLILASFSSLAQICFNPVVSHSLYNAGALALRSGDFNGDGKMDFAMANANGVAVHIQHIGGGFNLPSLIDSSSYSNTICMADMNNDGKLDIITHQYGPGQFAIYLGNGNGSFSLPSIKNTGLFNVNNTICSGDFNVDGKPDIAITTSFNLIRIYEGNGDGTLGSFVTITTPTAAYGQIESADFNNDGKSDLATSNLLLVCNGLGGFSPATSFGSSNQAMVVDDFNSDGKNDIVTQVPTPDSLAIFIGNGMGGVSGPTLFKLGDSSVSINPNRNTLVSGDYNNDGKKDIAAIHLTKTDTIYTTTVCILLGNGSGNFSAPIHLGIDNFAHSLLSLDINNDGGTDLAFLSRSLVDSSKLKILYDCNPTQLLPFNKGSLALRLFPNPSNETIHVECNEMINKIEVYDVVGKLIQVSTPLLLATTVHLRRSGVYTIRIVTNNNIISKKIIINY